MKGNCTKLERWNGTTWDLITKRSSIKGPSRMRETVEEPIVLDCQSGGGGQTKKKAPGTKEIGDIEVEILWNPTVPKDAIPGSPGTPAIENAGNHHLFEDDFDNETATFWRVRHPDALGTGIIVHATVKEIGEPEYKPNETVMRSITLEPTGEFYVHENDIENFDLPTTPEGPVDHWGE